ncbi:MAG: carboxypeptidase regulatory-like domain-containing protein [Bacteroidota bacterium]|nr:carboxypeptidase regulatory-like domain-containing protein [Bacteroidota bacterium]
MKTIFQYLLLSAVFLAPCSLSAQDLTTGDLKVTVLDERNQPMVGAIVTVVSSTTPLGAATDLDGVCTFRALNPGSYTVDAKMSGYKRYVKSGIMINAGQTAYAEYFMQVRVIESDTEVVIIAQAGPLPKEFSTVQNINAEQLKHNAAGRSNLMSLIEGTNSQLSIGKGGQLVMRGSREGASTLYVDGEKVYGSAGVPGGSIQGVTVLSGGIPAAFGDMSGGVVIITTKTFETGYNAKQAMYDARLEEEMAAKKAELEKSGQLIDKDGTIIEKAPATPAPQTPAPQAPVPVPVDGGGN